MRIVVGVLSLLLLTACGSSPASNPAAGGTPAPAPATTSAPAAPLDASGELAKLKAAGLPIGESSVVTAANDGNHLLGRPNGYTSKVYWTDTRVDQSKVMAPPGVDVGRGGSIESYPDTAGAKARKDYLVAVTKGLPAATEYDYLAGTSVIRVSALLTPDQAKQYEAAG